MQKPKGSESQRFTSVWDAVENTPEEAARMRALSKSKMEAEAVVRKSNDGGNPTTEAARMSAPREASIDELLALIGEVYQVVGILANECGRFDDPHVIKVMDNLAAGQMVHADVLPFPSKPNHMPGHCGKD